MAVPSPNILLALFIVSFSLSAIFHRSTTRRDPSSPPPPSVFNRYSADILVPSTNDTFASRPAAFGPPFDDLVQGQLIKAWADGLACTNYTAGETTGLHADHQEYRGKIVLVERGKCSFAEKVRRVQEIGGLAVIVGDNVPSSGGLLTMYAKGDTSDITVPSTFIPHASYLSLSYLLSLPAPLQIIILPSTASDWPLLDTLLLVILSPLFTLAFIYILLLLRRRIQRRKELAPLSVVRALPKRKWTREKHTQTPSSSSPAHSRPQSPDHPSGVLPEGFSRQTRRPLILECVVCLEDFIQGDDVVTLPCLHEFHEMCITPWLTTRRRLCPICKRDIIARGTGVDGVNERTPLVGNENPRESLDWEWRGETAGSP